MHTNFWNFGEVAAINKKRVIFKNCGTFTDCISKINNTQVEYATELDIVMAIYNLLE